MRARSHAPKFLLQAVLLTDQYYRESRVPPQDIQRCRDRNRGAVIPPHTVDRYRYLRQRLCAPAINDVSVRLRAPGFSGLITGKALTRPLS